MREEAGGLAGLRVLTLESRRATEQATLISRFGGVPIVAPSVREVPLDSHADAVLFADEVIAGRIDATLFLTGVGARELVRAIEQHRSRETFLAALRLTKVVARGPKPVAVLRDLQVPIWVVAPEPNTWREVIAAMDGRRDELPLAGARVAVQEYGVTNHDLMQALTARGAVVQSVCIYQWALPDDPTPLRNAVEAIIGGRVDLIVLTSGVQLAHLVQVATAMGLDAEMRRQLINVVIASIGPTTSEEIRRQGLEPDLQASHPKMGMLITEAAHQAAALLQAKRAR
ncbi:MAG: uroporphyrinogen-III synthase [Vicinamibacterales bacterium]